MSAKPHPPHLARLLDRQANLWELRRRLAQEGGAAARRELAHLQEGPWVTISKQIGSGGVELAHRVAAELGWQVYDREILEAIAEHTDVRDAILSRLDERDMSWMEDTVRRLIAPGEPGRAAYLLELARVVLSLARQGRAVILGRGANWLLNPEFGLRVRTVAPLEARIERFARETAVDAGTARARVQEEDREVGRFIRHAFGRDIDDPAGYDLVLNLGGMTLEAAAAAAVAGLRGKLSRPG